jgi:hypothetical protein
MPARIVVDPDELEGLAQALVRMKRDIETLGVRIAGYERALGPERVWRAVERLGSNWSDTREKVTAELEAISGLVMGAACSYHELEQRIAAAARGRDDPHLQRPPGGAEP